MTPLSQSHPRMGIIGGTHSTGAQFARLFAAQGFEVQVSGKDTAHQNHTLAKGCDVLVFAPPLKACVSIIEDVVPHCLRPDQLVLDLCSLKEAPMNAMARAQGRVLGLHPLFGPGFEDVSGQDLVLCDDRSDRDCSLYRALKGELEAMGLVVHEMSSVDHDKLMATIQVIPHLSALVSGALFRKLGINAAASLEICSPVYKTELYMIGRIHSQNPALYASIIGENPHTQRVVRELSGIIAQVEQALEAGDVRALEGVFLDNQAHLGDFAQEAKRESQRLLLAAFASKG